jgi:hypothetical protein
MWTPVSGLAIAATTTTPISIPTLCLVKPRTSSIRTAIPRTDDDLNGPANIAPFNVPDHLKAIAFTAGFHFCAIEQGGSSLYPSLAQRVTNVEVLRILLSIGPTETAHFQTW